MVCLLRKYFGDSGVWGMKWYAVGESGWGKRVEHGVLVCVCGGGRVYVRCHTPKIGKVSSN